MHTSGYEKIAESSPEPIERYVQIRKPAAALLKRGLDVCSELVMRNIKVDESRRPGLQLFRRKWCPSHFIACDVDHSDVRKGGEETLWNRPNHVSLGYRAVKAKNVAWKEKILSAAFPRAEPVQD